MISNYQPALLSAIESRGWVLANKIDYQDSPWFIEMWILESHWSPIGLKLFLAFEKDPFYPTAAIATEQPHDHHSTDWKARLYLKRGWEKNLPEFVSILDSLRSSP